MKANSIEKRERGKSNEGCVVTRITKTTGDSDYLKVKQDEAMTRHDPSNFPSQATYLIRGTIQLKTFMKSYTEMTLKESY